MSPPQTETPPEPAPDARGKSSFLQIFPSIVLPMFIAVLDQTIVATALPTMTSQLGDVQLIAWIVVSYLIANTIAAPVYGRLGDALGRARMMNVALFVMMAGSVGCALAPNVRVLIGARIVQGLGGGGLMTLSQSLISESVPPRDRARYQGYLAAVVVFSSAFGPVVGGWLTSLAGWRSIFWINLPLGLAALWLTRRLPPRKPPTGEFRFDTPGLLFFVLFVAPALIALEQIRHVTGINVTATLALAAVALCALALLVRRELRIAQPLFPFSLLRDPTIWRSDAMAACHGAALVSLIAYAPVYLRAARGLTPSQTGYFLLPIAFGIGVGSLVTGRLVSRTGRTAIFPSISLVPVAITLFLVALFHERITPVWLSAIIGAMSLFMGSVMGVVQVTVQNAAGFGMLGAAAGSVQFSRAIGASFGTALVGALMLAVFTQHDPGGVSVFGELLEHGPSALHAISADARALAENGLTASFRAVFLTIDAFIVLALIAAWSIPTRRL